MNSQKKYTTQRICMAICLAVLAVMIWLNVAIPEPTLEPDAVYPMTNTHVTWLQTFHSGGWEE